MTIRQQILKWAYPLFVEYKKLRGRNRNLEPATSNIPKVPFHSLSAISNNGTELLFESFKNKKVLIVNTASNCGYTNQYKELQNLYESHKENLVVLAFPSNDFKEQENGNDEEIARFCQENFGITFLLTKKSVVIKRGGQHKVFEWLTHKKFNGWNEQQPTWNFSKYLVNEKGMLTHYFDPAVSPLGSELIKAINE
jgi:glutathione peroxidase